MINDLCISSRRSSPFGLFSVFKNHIPISCQIWISVAFVNDDDFMADALIKLCDASL